MSAEKVAFITKCLELDVAALEGLLGQLDRIGMLRRSSRLAEIAYTAALLAPTRPPRSPAASSTVSTGTRRAYVLQPIGDGVRLALHPESGARHEPRLLQHFVRPNSTPAGNVQPQLTRASTGARRQKRAILDLPLQLAGPVAPPAPTRRTATVTAACWGGKWELRRRVEAGSGTGLGCWSGQSGGPRRGGAGSGVSVGE